MEKSWGMKKPGGVETPWHRVLFFDRTDPDWCAVTGSAGRRSRLPVPIAGVDEAGRGPWAGPVVAAAVILDPHAIPGGLDDSKALSEAERERLYPLIMASARVGVGIVDAPAIDDSNILAATFRAMQQAVTALDTMPRLALIDGNRAPALPCATHCLIKGDGRSPAIAAASVIAKVTRDRIMADLDKAHPGYGWARNKGYGTKTHALALDTLGPSAQHRRSFKPVARVIEARAPGPQTRTGAWVRRHDPTPAG